MSSLTLAASRGGGGGKSAKRSAAPKAATAINTSTAAALTSPSDEDDLLANQPTPSLPKLLSALALGVRAANGLPAPKDSDYQDDGDDDLAFLMAFPEFAAKCHEGRAELSVLLSDILSSVKGSISAANDNDDGDCADDTASPEEDGDYGFESPLLWEKAAEACEYLLEEVDAFIQDVKDGSSNVAGSSSSSSSAIISASLESAAAKARQKSKGGYSLMMSGIVDMDKPQITYDFAKDISNARTEPFVPPVHPDKPYGVVPLEHTLRPMPGHGIESRNGDFGANSAPGSGDGTVSKIPDDIVAPDVHYPHQYEQEIRTLQYRDWQLAVETEERLGEHGVGGTLNRSTGAGSSVPTEKGLWIDTEKDLERLVRRINNPAENIREIAVDLEAHSHRTFGGITCLMQLSLRRKSGGSSLAGGSSSTIETASDFLIDAIALRKVMNHHLAAIFANPDIVKVMHGADSDIPWLQRDFGIYVVNLFDTGRAARALPHFSSAGLAYLLGRYAGVEADKKHQLSDWRQRPLPDEMAAYATSDTVYLLDSYDRIKLDLKSHSDPRVSIISVLDDSKKVCLIRYDKEPFRPSGYKSIISSKRNKRKRSASLDPKNERVLRALYDWRDTMARELDESLHYVCPNTALVRIATMCPRTVGALQGLVNPCPPLVVRYSDEVLRVIKTASAEPNSQNAGAIAAHSVLSPKRPIASSPEKISQLRASASPFAFFRPAEESDNAGAAQGGAGNGRDLPPRPSERQNPGIMSPVAGTDVLFKEAGWMTPQGDALMSGTGADGPDAMEMDGHASTEDESDSGKKRRQLLSIDKANENYVANKCSRHSLEMGSSVNEETGRRAKSVDGLGAAREALKGQGGSPLQRASNAAKSNADKVQNDLVTGNHGILSLAKSDRFGAEDSTNMASPDRSVKSQESENGEGLGEEDPIPRSMKEIYEISNRNRKGSKAPIPVQKRKPEAVMDVDNLEGAEAMLAKSGPGGSGYFEKNAIGLAPFDEKNRRKPPEGVKELPPSKEEDVSLMTKIGWIKDEDEAFQMLAERNSGNDEQNKQQSGEDTKVVMSKGDGEEGDSGFVSKSRKRGQRGRGSHGSQQAQEPFDYSKVGSIGAYGPKGAPALANPFFSGAAVSGGTLSGGQQQSSERRGRGGGNKGKKKGGGGGGGSGSGGERIGRRDAGNKTYVYRGGQR